MIKLHRLVLLLVFLAACDQGQTWQAYSDPTGTFSVDVPRSWKAAPAKNTGFSSIVSFYPPGGSAEFTMSATTRPLELPDELPLDLVRPFFPPDCVVSPARRFQHAGRSAIRQDCTGSLAGSPRTWLGAFYGSREKMIGITLSEATANVDAHREPFERIVTSLRFR